jgi:MFS family permease
MDKRALVLALASLVLSVGFGLNAWKGTAPGYAAAIAVWTLGEILFAPASMSLVADLAPAHLRGRYQDAFAAAPAVGGYVITPFIEASSFTSTGTPGWVDALPVLRMRRLGRPAPVTARREGGLSAVVRGEG